MLNSNKSISSIEDQDSDQEDSGYHSLSDEEPLDFATVIELWRARRRILAYEDWVPRLLQAARAAEQEQAMYKYLSTYNFEPEGCIRLLAKLCYRGDHVAVSHVLRQRQLEMDASHRNSPVSLGVHAIQDILVQGQGHGAEEVIDNISKAMESLRSALIFSPYIAQSARLSPVPVLYDILRMHSDKLQQDAYERLISYFYQLLIMEEITEIPLKFHRTRQNITQQNERQESQEGLKYLGNTLMIAAIYHDRRIYEQVQELDGAAKRLRNRIYEAVSDAIYDSISATAQVQTIAHSAFIAACANQELALFILQHWPPSNAQINQQDREGRSALWHAYSHGHNALINALQMAGATVADEREKEDGCTMLMAACKACNSEWTQWFVTNSHRSAKDEYGNRAMHYLAQSQPGHNMEDSLEKYSKIIEILLDRRHNPNAENKHGLTPLMIAVLNGNMPCIQALLDAPHELNINKTDKQGKTALIHAVEQGRWEIIELLLNDRRTHARICDNRGLDALTIFLTFNCKAPHGANNASNSSTATNAPVINTMGEQVVMHIDHNMQDEQQPTSIWSSLYNYAARTATWLKETFTSKYNVTFKRPDSAPIPEMLHPMVRCFLERGADPGASYGYDGSQMLTSISIPTFIHNVMPKLLSLALPEGLANRLVWYVNAQYCIKPVVSNMVSNFMKNLSGTAENISNISQSTTDYGFFHLNWYGGVQHKDMGQRAQSMVAEKFYQSPRVIYQTLIDRYSNIEQSKYALLYDGKWWNIPFKICTAPWRIHKMNKMQESLIQATEQGFKAVFQNPKYLSKAECPEFVQYLERSLIDDTLLRNLASSKPFSQLAQDILNYRVPVAPDLYHLVWQYNGARRCKHYDRIYGVLEDLWVSIRLYFLDIMTPMDEQQKLVKPENCNWWQPLVRLKDEAMQRWSTVQEQPPEVPKAAKLEGGLLQRCMEKMRKFCQTDDWLPQFDPETLGEFCGQSASYLYSLYCSFADISWLKENAGILLTSGIGMACALPYASTLMYITAGVGMLSLPWLAYRGRTQAAAQEQESEEQQRRQDKEDLLACIEEVQQEQQARQHDTMPLAQEPTSLGVMDTAKRSWIGERTGNGVNVTSEVSV